MSNVYYCATVTQNPTSRFTGEVGWRGTLRGLGKVSKLDKIVLIQHPWGASTL